MKVMCKHCGSPNLDTDAACYDCGKPLLSTSKVEPKDKPAKPEKKITPAKKATKPA